MLIIEKNTLRVRLIKAPWGWRNLDLTEWMTTQYILAEELITGELDWSLSFEGQIRDPLAPETYHVMYISDTL